MKPLISVEELKNLREQAQARLAEQEKKIQVKIHLGTCGISSGANKILEAFVREVDSHKLSDVVVLKAACIGLCGREPVVTVITPGKEKVIYCDLDEDKIPQIVEEHLVGRKPIKEWTLDLDAPWFKLQEIRVMHNQDLDPMDIEQYIARGGYQALAKVLTQMSPEDVIEEVRKAGLRGRGGAGFPVGLKWHFTRQELTEEKYIVCNAEEGELGIYKDRVVLEGNPYSIIEGVTIGGYAIGARRGFIYAQIEYPLVIETLNHALAQAREYGFLGENILGSGFGFDIDLYLGGGAYICGEETALLESIEGKRGTPRLRPPFPAAKGLFEKPTAINNVESIANIPLIILRGADWFASVGTERSKGTKLFCLAGKVKNIGLVEVPFGLTVRQMVFDIGGGVPNGRKFKAALIGGPTGGCIPPDYLDTPVDFEPLSALGAALGAGGLVVMDEDNCVVDLAKYLLEFSKEESCGKCIPCRAGTAKMLEIVTKLTKGDGTIEDLSILEELADMVGAMSLCGLGQAAPTPVLSTLRHFRKEYEAHIIDKRCPAGVCRLYQGNNFALQPERS